jgi:signal transduction histidine kinase
LHIAPTPTDLQGFLDSLRKLVLGEIRSGAKVNVHLDKPTDPASASGRYAFDRRRVQQVCLNLLHNSFKFAKRGLTQHVVNLRVSPCMSRPKFADGTPPANLPDLLEQGTVPVYLLFELSDNGIGIAPNEVAKLFLRFSQPKRTHISAGGTSISRSCPLPNVV